MDRTASGIAVIVDIVRSRDIADRRRAQQQLVDALARVNDAVTATQPLAPVVGDESQAIYPDLASALRATLMLRLELPAPLDCRAGIGAGWYAAVGGESGPVIQDGSAWWAARAAVDEGRRRETGRTPSLRTWFVVGDAARGSAAEATPEPDAIGTAPAALVNAYLLARDHLIGEMDARSRRLLLGTLQGLPQNTLAQAERITQSAVSRNLHRNGAFAIIDGAALLD